MRRVMTIAMFMLFSASILADVHADDYPANDTNTFIAPIHPTHINPYTGKSEKFSY